MRTGEDLDFYSILDFETVDGSAIQGSDFHFAQGSIKFAPGEKVAYVTLHIVDDDEFEEDEHFKLRIFNLRNAKVGKSLFSLLYDTFPSTSAFWFL